MKTIDGKIEQTLRDHSEWSGSADALWGRISNQLQPEPAKSRWRRKPVWIGTAAAATVFLAFLLQAMYNPLPPDVPEVTDLARMKTFSMSMVAEPEAYPGGEDVELTLHTSPAIASEPEVAIRLFVWKQIDLEEILAGEMLINEEEIRGRDSLWVQSPSEAGLYRLVVEGTFTDDGERIFVFAERTIFIKGEKSDEKLEDN